MAIFHDRAEDIYKLLNTSVFPVSIPDIERHLEVGRNSFHQLSRHPYIIDATPKLKHNKKYTLRPCTLDAFLANLPGGKTTEDSGPANVITIERRLTKTSAVHTELELLGQQAALLATVIQYATDHYADEPKINNEVRETISTVKTAAVAVLNWINQVELDPRYSSDDTAYAMFVMEDD
jgi:hypothetical protein